MPLYVYEIIRADSKPGRRLEIFQKFSEKPLRRDPESGQPVRRVFSAPHLPKNRYEKALKTIGREDSPRRGTPRKKSR
ncbi:MAG: hypothetical protein FGM27_07615 [Candidatus Omnitrophica bacterium]|nr:hypothetical protein [Candidatus Omnitrophota bacterium]